MSLHNIEKYRDEKLAKIKSLKFEELAPFVRKESARYGIFHISEKQKLHYKMEEVGFKNRTKKAFAQKIAANSKIKRNADLLQMKEEELIVFLKLSFPLTMENIYDIIFLERLLKREKVQNFIAEEGAQLFFNKMMNKKNRATQLKEWKK